MHLSEHESGTQAPVIAPDPDDPLRPAARGLIPLERLCPYLGMCFEVGRRKYARGTLPVKAFRLNDSRRGPLYVHVDDLDAYIASRRQRGLPAYVQG